jgi:UDP-N-acetylmuramoyl-tripeptide--D-alanyl-D-alanine ligase
MLLSLASTLLAEQPSPAKLTTELLRTSLDLGTQFLLANQKPAGNFQYLFDWKRQQYSEQDGQVRQAGAIWGLTTIHAYQPNEQVEVAIHKALDFMNQRSRLRDDGARFIVYPGVKQGATGTVALVTLAHLDYLQGCEPGDPVYKKYRPFADDYLKFLLQARRDDGQWHSRYDILSGRPTGDPSPYFDGEALLALVKAAKYHGYDQLRDEVLASARAGYATHVRRALSNDADSAITKGYYQWSSMAFFELATSGWEGTEEFGDHVIELADWMIDVHRTLERPRNTAYAYEGIIHAYELAKLRGDQPHVEKYGDVIRRGLARLLSWQLGSPVANAFVRKADNKDIRSHGGVQNHAAEPLLRIDVTQHQMHAVTLALKYAAN